MDVDKAIDNNMSSLGQDIKASAREENLAVLKPNVLPGPRLEAVLVGADKQEAFEALLKKQFASLKIDAKETLPEDRGQVSAVHDPGLQEVSVQADA